MFGPTRLALFFAVSALVTFADTISFTGPTTPAGVPCVASDPGCVLGGTPFAIYGVQLAQPSLGNPNWTLTIEMNYPASISTPGNSIPTAIWGADGQSYSTSDFLIKWNGQDYGIVLAQHIKAGNTVDTYQAGNLYQAPNTQFDLTLSGDPNDLGAPGVLPSAPRRDEPVWLSPGGTLLGSGTVSVVAGGNGTPAQYTITDSFNVADPNFLSSGSFQIFASSWVCFNGVIVATGDFNSSSTPEPGTLALAVPLLLLFGFRLFSHRKT